VCHVCVFCVCDRFKVWGSGRVLLVCDDMICTNRLYTDCACEGGCQLVCVCVRERQRTRERACAPIRRRPCCVLTRLFCVLVGLFYA